MHVVMEQKILNIYVTDWKGRVHGNEWYAISFVVYYQQSCNKLFFRKWLDRILASYSRSSLAAAFSFFRIRIHIVKMKMPQV